MKFVCGLTMLLGCLHFTSLAKASAGGEIALNKLPQHVTDRIRDSYSDAKLLRAWKEAEHGKECYSVRIMSSDRIIELYVSPDGGALVTKEQGFSLTKFPERLMAYFLLLVLPGAIAGFCVRWLIQAAKGKTLSVLSEWLSAWIGAGIFIAILLTALTTASRNKDAAIIGAVCVVWGAISASLVEVIGLTVQSVRGYRVGCRRWILGICLVGLVFLGVSIPVDMLSIERENQYLRAIAMRPPAG